MSVPSVRERVALAFVIRMPELGLATREQMASLAGLAPFVRQSGKWKKETHIGRGRLRRSLFAVTFPGALHWNPALVALKIRMMARGASHTSEIIACARKLLVPVRRTL